MKLTVKYKNVTMYIKKMDNGYWNATYSGMSICKVGDNLEKLVEEFGEYLNELQERFNKKEVK